VTGIFGSWRFIIVQTFAVAAWVAANLIGFADRWDPYPFILLNLLFSTQTAYAAPLILLSQNRQSDTDRIKAEHDYRVNQLALGYLVIWRRDAHGGDCRCVRAALDDEPLIDLGPDDVGLPEPHDPHAPGRGHDSAGSSRTYVTKRRGLMPAGVGAAAGRCARGRRVHAHPPTHDNVGLGRRAQVRPAADLPGPHRGLASSARSLRAAGTVVVRGPVPWRMGSGIGVLSERMVTVLALLNGAEGDVLDGESHRAGVAAAAALGVDGVSAGVGTGPQGTVVSWGREEVGAALEDLQFTIGQGPGLDAVASGAPVLVADVREHAVRWPGFVPGALELGVRAVFAFPLRIGAICVGVLTAHRAVPGPLADGQLADALGLAEAVSVLLLHRAPGEGMPVSGRVRPETHRAHVHQATGMISVQLEVSLAEALVRLRAYAYARNRAVAEVAGDVVARRLRFQDPDR
jgi:GAF domain-containing protein